MNQEDSTELNFVIMFLELVKLNLNSDNRIACLEKEHEFYCGDGVVQVNMIFASYEN